MSHPKTVRKFRRTFHGAFSDISLDWREELENYIVYGFKPGSFFAAIYSDTLFGAALTTHPDNSWMEICHVVTWLISTAPPNAFGSLEAVSYWLSLSDDQRRAECEQAGILATPWELLQEP